MKHIGKVLLQIVFLWVVFQIGNYIVAFVGVPLPGNVLGMLLLFTLLSTGVIPVSWVKEATDILLKHLAFFFIPIAVGLMVWGDLFAKSGVWLLLALIISAAIAIAVTGFVVQVTYGKKGDGNL